MKTKNKIDIAELIYQSYATKSIKSKETIKLEKEYEKLFDEFKKSLSYQQNKAHLNMDDAMYAYFSNYEKDIICYVLDFVKALQN